MTPATHSIRCRCAACARPNRLTPRQLLLGLGWLIVAVPVLLVLAIAALVRVAAGSR